MSSLKLTMILVVYMLSITLIASSKDRCGEDYGECDDGECCSQYNWCGTSDEHCGEGCQKAYGICNSGDSGKSDKSDKPDNPDTEFEPDVGKIEWVGFRFSEGGVKSKRNYGKIPDGDSWVEFVEKMKRNFNEDAKPTVIVIVSQNSDDVVNVFGFPAPKGYSETKYINYDSSDKFEKILTKFDEVGFNVWLQVEPGDNDIVELAKIVFKQYGHHTCVKGFGIDLEWWYRGDDGEGSKLSDDYAKKIVDYVRSINPDYTVFAKHWDTKFMPPTYRKGMIFVDDSQEFDSLSSVKSEFKEWAQKFKDNPVIFQIGYEADEHLWLKNPVDFAKAIIDEVTKYNKHVGIMWVDFTMRDALKKM